MVRINRRCICASTCWLAQVHAANTLNDSRCDSCSSSLITIFLQKEGPAGEHCTSQYGFEHPWHSMAADDHTLVKTAAKLQRL